MLELTITNNVDKFIIKDREILNMELKLNITEYGKVWSHIGDHLFDFYNQKNNQKNLNNILIVDDDQFKFLKDLSEKNYQEMINNCSKYYNPVN